MNKNKNKDKKEFKDCRIYPYQDPYDLMNPKYMEYYVNYNDRVRKKFELFRKAYDDKSILWGTYIDIPHRKYIISGMNLGNRLGNLDYHTSINLVVRNFPHLSNEDVFNIHSRITVEPISEHNPTGRLHWNLVVSYEKFISSEWILYSDHLRNLREGRLKKLLDK